HGPARTAHAARLERRGGSNRRRGRAGRAGAWPHRQAVLPVAFAGASGALPHRERRCALRRDDQGRARRQSAPLEGVSVIPQKGITLDAALRDLQSERWEARAMAAGALGSVAEADHETAAAALRRTLRDDRGEVRFAAAMSLAELRDRAAAPMLVDQLED